MLASTPGTGLGWGPSVCSEAPLPKWIVNVDDGDDDDDSLLWDTPLLMKWCLPLNPAGR